LPAGAIAIADPARFAAVVKAAFGQRRKTLRNALAGVLTPAQISAAGLDPGARAEQVAVAGYVALAALAPG
jgi:16S rRNA (adenine1518-N6/adenine1519-N6)-dimethyltransferase